MSVIAAPKLPIAQVFVLAEDAGWYYSLNGSKAVGPFEGPIPAGRAAREAVITEPRARRGKSL